MASTKRSCGRQLAVILAALTASAVIDDVRAADSSPSAHCVDLAKGKFLVASRGIIDPRFSESVILLVDHDDKGTLGLIVNRSSDISLAEALPQVESLSDRKDKLFLGGPVARRSVLLLMDSKRPPPGAVQVFGSIYFSQGASLLDGILGEKAGDFRVYAGYAGWGSGQLAAELARGDWFVADADAHSVFSKMPSTVWPALIMRFEGQWARRAMTHPGC